MRLLDGSWKIFFGPLLSSAVIFGVNSTRDIRCMLGVSSAESMCWLSLSDGHGNFLLHSGDFYILAWLYC